MNQPPTWHVSTVCLRFFTLAFMPACKQHDSSPTCPGLQIHIIQIRLCRRGCVHRYTNTRKYTNTRFYTHFTHNCTQAPAHTHIPYTRCVCISEYTNPRTHSLPPSHTHTSTGPQSPMLPLLVPYQQPALPSGAPLAALPSSQALLR